MGRGVDGSAVEMEVDGRVRVSYVAAWGIWGGEWMGVRQWWWGWIRMDGWLAANLPLGWASGCVGGMATRCMEERMGGWAGGGSTTDHQTKKAFRTPPWTQIAPN